jgi:hypothetical protein
VLAYVWIDLLTCSDEEMNEINERERVEEQRADEQERYERGRNNRESESESESGEEREEEGGGAKRRRDDEDLHQGNYSDRDSESDRESDRGSERSSELSSESVDTFKNGYVRYLECITCGKRHTGKCSCVIHCNANHSKEEWNQSHAGKWFKERNLDTFMKISDVRSLPTDEFRRFKNGKLNDLQCGVP